MSTEIRFDEFCSRITSSAEFGFYKRCLDASARFDAAIDTGQIARALLYVKKIVFEVKYPQFMARELIPVSHDAPAGAETIATPVWDQIGQAKIIANHADDIPRVDARLSEEVVQVRTLADAYAYSVLDLERAAMTGQPLESRKAMAANRAIEQSIEDIAAVGDSQSGLGGMLNNANVPIEAATGAWSGLTPVQVIADMSRLASNMLTATSAAEQPDTLILPTALYSLAGQTPYSTLNGQTLLSVFQQYNPYIKNVYSWVKLNTAGAGGVKRIVAYRKAPDVLTLEMPQEFTTLPPQARNLDFVVICRARTAGVAIRYPLAMRYMDGA